MSLHLGLSRSEEHVKSVSIKDLFESEINLNVATESIQDCLTCGLKISDMFDNVMQLRKVAKRYNSQECLNVIKALTDNKLSSISFEGFMSSVFEKVKAFFKMLWEKIKGFFTAIKNWFSKLFHKDNKIPVTAATVAIAATTAAVNSKLETPIPKEVIEEAKKEDKSVIDVLKEAKEETKKEDNLTKEEKVIKEYAQKVKPEAAIQSVGMWGLSELVEHLSGNVNAIIINNDDYDKALEYTLVAETAIKEFAAKLTNNQSWDISEVKPVCEKANKNLSAASELLSTIDEETAAAHDVPISHAVRMSRSYAEELYDSIPQMQRELNGIMANVDKAIAFYQQNFVGDEETKNANAEAAKVLMELKKSVGLGSSVCVQQLKVCRKSIESIRFAFLKLLKEQGKTVNAEDKEY